MALKKCPKCELNYIKDDETWCSVYLRELRHSQNGGADAAEEITICTECGEAPVVAGSELCLACLREQKRQAELESASELDAAFEEAIAADEAEEDEEE